MEALIFLTTGFEEIEALATVDILRRGGVDVRMVSLIDDRTVTGGHQISVIADCMFEEANFDAAKMLILPGGTVKINDHAGLKRKILEFAKNGKAIAAICAAPMVFGGLGLLKGKRATCYPGYEKYLTDAEVTGTYLEIAGNITTARAAGYTQNFAIELLAQLKGDEVAYNVEQQIEPKI